MPDVQNEPHFGETWLQASSPESSPHNMLARLQACFGNVATNACCELPGLLEVARLLQR